MIGLIPAAGKGTRLKELGKHYSKTILPYKEKPLLIHQIEWLESQGCSEIRIVVNHKSEDIKRILKMYEKEPKIIRQDEMNGLSGAIFCGLKSTPDCSVLICLGDIVPTSTKILNFTNNFVSVQRVDDYERWCMVGKKDGEIQFYDKPSERPDTDLALSGVYYLKSAVDVMKHLCYQMITHKSKEEAQFSFVLERIAQKEYISIVQLTVIDFGTLQEYLENKGVKDSRSFNTITSNEYRVTKSSKINKEKIRDEVNWFKDVPLEIQELTPRIYDSNFFMHGGSYEYTMERILAPTLREIYLFLDSSKATWDSIFDTLFNNLLMKMGNYTSNNNFMKSVVKKTIERTYHINDHIEDLSQEDEEIIHRFIDHKLPKIVREYEEDGCLMHGDFCFSNILYDMNSNKATMIDPRGELEGNHYYDVAKLYHSVICDYDFVDAELYSIDSSGYTLYNKGKEEVKLSFLDILNDYYSDENIEHIKLITASLFLSMIPLHSHNRNNQRIYFEIFKDLEKDL